MGSRSIKHSLSLFYFFGFDFKSQEWNYRPRLGHLYEIQILIVELNRGEGSDAPGKITHFHFPMVTNDLKEDLFQKILWLALCKQSFNVGSQGPLWGILRPEPSTDLVRKILFSALRCLFKSQFFLYHCWGIDKLLESLLKSNLSILRQKCKITVSSKMAERTQERRVNFLTWNLAKTKVNSLPLGL